MAANSSTRRSNLKGARLGGQSCKLMMAAAAIASASIRADHASAAVTTYNWDPGQTAAGTGSGGSGNWDTTDLFWYPGTGTADVAFPSSATLSAANFAGAAGTATLTSAIAAYGSTFATGGYTVATGANTLTIGAGGITTTNTTGTTTVTGLVSDSATSTWAVAAGGTLQFNAALANVTGVGLQINSAGTTNITGNFSVNGKSTLAGGGTFNLSGTEAFETAATDYAGIAAVTVNNTAGTATFTPGTGNGFFIGNGGSGTTAVLDVTGGSVVIGNATRFYIGDGYNGTAGALGDGVLTIGGGASAARFTTGTTANATNLMGGTAATGTVNLLTNGTLSGNRSYAAGATGKGIFTFNGGTFQATGTTAGLASGLTTTIADNGGTIDSQTFAITIASNIGHGGTSATDGGLTLMSSAATGKGAITLSGVLSQTGGLTFNTGGTISGNNTYAGATAVNAFVDAKTSGNVFGATGAGNGTTINTGGTVRFRDTSNASIPEAFTLNGGTFYTYNDPGTTTLSGAITLNANTTLSVSPQAQTSTTLLLSGGIADGTTTGNNLILSRVGAAAAASSDVLSITGASTYGGTTSITDALNTNTGNFSVKLSGGNDRLPTGTSVTLGGTAGGGNAAGSGRLILGDATTGAISQTLAGLVTSGTGTRDAVVGGNATASTLNLNIASSDTFTGTLGGTGTNENSLALSKLGAGALTLSGTDGYVGGTTISAGSLITANASALGSGTVNVTGGGLTLGNGTTDTVTGVSGLAMSDATTLKLAASDSSLTLASGTFTLGNIDLDLNNAFNSAGSYTLLFGAGPLDSIGTTTFLNADTADYTYSFGVSGNNGVLNVASVAVPEPASLSLLALGGLGLIRRRRQA